MPEPMNGWTDERVEQVVGRLLQLGVLVAATVGVAGGALYLLHHGGDATDFRAFRGVPHGLESVGGVVAGVRALDTASVVQAALLLLIATPILRVALSLVAFAAQRDRTYVAITTLVLTLLLWSLLGPGGR